MAAVGFVGPSYAVGLKIDVILDDLTEAPALRVVLSELPSGMSEADIRTLLNIASPSASGEGLSFTTTLFNAAAVDGTYVINDPDGKSVSDYLRITVRDSRVGPSQTGGVNLDFVSHLEGQPLDITDIIKDHPQIGNPIVENGKDRKSVV